MNRHTIQRASAILLTVVLPQLACGASAQLPSDSVEIGNQRFYTGGPIRYPPVTWRGKTFLGSDDGYLYCLDSKTGQMQWKYRGGPTNRKMLGAGRLISAWPISGGPLIHKDRVYFAAGVWPFMGVFVFALDAETGNVVWVNDSATTRWKSDAVSEQRPKQPTFEPSFVSVTPMGRLSVSDDRLVVPCGRAEPAYFDLKTGRLIQFHHGYKKPHRWGEGNLTYPDYDAVAVDSQGCFPKSPRAEAIMDAANVRDGYALILGIGDGRIVEGLVTNSNLRVIAIDPDQTKVSSLRKLLDDAGMNGTRAAVHVGDPLDFGLPPYIASLIVAADSNFATATAIAHLQQTVVHCLRPYGGVVCLSNIDQVVARHLSPDWLPGAKIERRADLILLRRIGALPGSDSWSHEFANAANTRSTSDDLVKSPFATLWFGGRAAERHRYYENHRGYAVPKVAGGRLFIEGPKLISAFDVYTGRFLWDWRPSADDNENWHYFGRGVNWAFEPMAGRTTASSDALYVVSDQTLHAIDAATGMPVPSFRFAEKGDWGGVRLVGDLLLVPTAESILALDRHTGSVQWRRKGFGGTLAVGGGKVFCTEYPWPDRFNNPHISPDGRWTKFIKEWERIKRRGNSFEKKEQKCAAFDLHTGERVWEIQSPVVRSPVRRMIYSAKHDLLLLPGSGRIYHAENGEQMWRVNITEKAMLSGDLVWGYGKLNVVANLVTRTVNERINPITLERQQWSMKKSGNGCGPIVAGRHLVTLRSGSAAYCDLGGDSSQTYGVINLGGFRSSCQPSLIPADGLLVSPNSASGGCTCRYPLATALAMVHAPEMEKWGSFGTLALDGPIRRLGINFGAPGDRLASDGVLWLDFPMVGGPSPDIEVDTDPQSPEWFRRHSSCVVQGKGHPWIAASGAKNLKSVTIRLGTDQPRLYQVRVQYAKRIGSGDKLSMTVKTALNVRASHELVWKFDSGMYVCGIEIVEMDSSGHGR